MIPQLISPKPELQYTNLAQQGETAELGMWVFLATEVLFFGGMMMAYLTYRISYPADFTEAAHHSIIWIGATNTVVLLTSSVTMVTAIYFAEQGETHWAVRLLLATAALGVVFLCLKGFEYYLDYRDGDVPILKFDLNGPAELFWLFYFYATLLHGIHLTIGIGLVLYMAVRVHRGRLSPNYTAPLEVVGLYWSFVDTVWIFLFALIYPIGRSL